MGLNPLHAAAHVAAGFLSLWKSEVASRAAYYLDPTERMDPDAWDGDPDFDIPLCHFCDLPSGHDGPHKDCMCGKCQPAKVIEVDDLTAAQCSYPMVPNAVAMSDCCGQRAYTAAAFGQGYFYRCRTHEGVADDGECVAAIPLTQRPPVVPVAVDDCPPVSPATGLPVEQLDWLEPCVLNLLAEHRPNNYYGRIECVDWEGKPHAVFRDHYVWREHWWQELRDRLERAARKK